MPENAFRHNQNIFRAFKGLFGSPYVPGSELFPCPRLRATLSLMSLPASRRSPSIIPGFLFRHPRNFFRSPHHLFILPNFSRFPRPGHELYCAPLRLFQASESLVSGAGIFRSKPGCCILLGSGAFKSKQIKLRYR